MKNFSLFCNQIIKSSTATDYCDQVIKGSMNIFSSERQVLAVFKAITLVYKKKFRKAQKYLKKERTNKTQL